MKSLTSIIVVLFFLACFFAGGEAITDQCRTWFRNTCKYYDGATRGNLDSVIKDSLNHFEWECGGTQWLSSSSSAFYELLATLPLISLCIALNLLIDWLTKFNKSNCEKKYWKSFWNFSFYPKLNRVRSLS